MGLLCDYFIADDDKQAEAVIDWPGGPAAGVPKRGFFGRATGGLPTVEGRGVEPVVVLGMLQQLLTGKSFDDQLADPQSPRMVAMRDEGERLVIRIGDDLVRALSRVELARLQSLAHPWADIEEFHGQADPLELAFFLEALRDLARRAEDSPGSLYCWLCV